MARCTRRARSSPRRTASAWRPSWRPTRTSRSSPRAGFSPPRRGFLAASSLLPRCFLASSVALTHLPLAPAPSLSLWFALFFCRACTALLPSLGGSLPILSACFPCGQPHGVAPRSHLPLPRTLACRPSPRPAYFIGADIYFKPPKKPGSQFAPERDPKPNQRPFLVSLQCVTAEGYYAALPHIHGIDGAFGARLRRRAGDAAAAAAV